MKGYLIVNVYVGSVANPVMNALVKIREKEMAYFTDENGKTSKIELEVKDKNLSQEPNNNTEPYALYTITISRPGLVTKTIKGVEIYPGIESIQDVYLDTIDDKTVQEEVLEIDKSTLSFSAEYAPKIFEEEEENEKISLFVLPSVVIPEYIIVHDGTPSKATAAKYYVTFTDYIKNVACCEIYPTWPKETIKANVLAIISFTLNRIYTEWYHGKGFNFTITSTTSYDHKYTHGRTLFDTIVKLVDEIFNKYIKFPNRTEPYLAHYNDGIKLNNAGWLNQWGSKDLGDKGYSAIDILKHYYGKNLEINESTIYEGYPTSFPGFNLQLNACGEYVQKIQNELNKIRGSYPAIPLISNSDGMYLETTKKAVEVFQKVFSLPITGIVDFTTWYKISYVFVAVTKMTEATYK